MAKPKIIIADTSIDYLLPLQSKFVEEFYEKIDLEIITDPTFFQEIFSFLHPADILIVSEELYDSSLQRQNIPYVFLLTEEDELEATAPLNVSTIFKYTSTAEVFNRIVGISKDILKTTAIEKKECQIVTVYSAAGGTGKTTVAMGIAGALTNNFKKTLYINATHLQTFQYLLSNPTPITSSKVYSQLMRSSENIYQNVKEAIRKEVFDYLPPFKTALISLGVDYSIFQTLITSAKKSNEYDYIIVDTDSSFDEDKANILSLSDKVIIITNHTLSAISATNILISNINGINQDKYIFICNNYDNSDGFVSDIQTNYSIDEYVDKFKYQMKMEELSKEASMNKLAFLIM